MAKMTLKIDLKSDKQHVLVSLLKEGNLLDSILLTSDAVSRLIALLSNNRAQIAEPIPHELDPNARVETVVRPFWRLRKPKASGAERWKAPTSAIVELRHPGLGWLGFRFDLDEAEKLGRGLLAIADEHRAAIRKS